MPGLHLPRTPYDLFVYDFPYDFSGIVGGYSVCVYIHAMCDFLYRLLAMNWGKAVWRPRGDGTKIVQSSHRNCTEPVASVQGSTEIVRWLCSCVCWTARPAIIACSLLLFCLTCSHKCATLSLSGDIAHLKTTVEIKETAEITIIYPSGKC